MSTQRQVMANGVVCFNVLAAAKRRRRIKRECMKECGKRISLIWQKHCPLRNRNYAWMQLPVILILLLHSLN